jgi:hypothetical protein
MNDKIKQLHIEAWDYACNKIPQDTLGQNNHEEYFSEKFAELLEKEFESKYFSLGYLAGKSDSVIDTVRDCAGWIEIQGMVEVAQEMKQRFGIE